MYPENGYESGWNRTVATGRPVAQPFGMVAQTGLVREGVVTSMQRLIDSVHFVGAKASPRACFRGYFGRALEARFCNNS